MPAATTLPVAPAAPSIGRGPRLAERTLTVPAMGGSLHLRVAYASRGRDAAAARAATADLRRVAARVDRWAARLTRFDDASDLAALNADPTRSPVAVRPTLAAVLDWAERATDLAPGLLDITLLDERLAAEAGIPGSGPPVTDRPPGPARRWHLVRRLRGGTVVRHGPFRFDLDGVAKGWIADRALAMLRAYPAALVDADGDIAVRAGEGVTWDIGVADPRDPGGDDLAILRLDGRLPGGTIGIATSGTSVHRWAAGDDGSPRHHLLDPNTRRPARTDVVQATVIGATAREAEVLAKAAVIAGSGAALGLLEAAGVHGALLLLEDRGVRRAARDPGLARMKYRGLGRRTRVVAWLLFGAAVVAILAATGGGALGAVGSWLAAEQDRLPWYATRLLGLLAYLVISASVIYGLLLSTGILDAVAQRTVSFTLHQDLSAIGLGLALVHAAMLTLDRSVPYTVAEVFLPLIGPYRPVWVAMGQFALAVTVVVVASFSLRKRIGQKRWRTLHYVSFVAFVAATAHGLMAGTDTAATWALWGYLLTTALVVFLTAYRIVLAVATRRGWSTKAPTQRVVREVTPAPAATAAPAAPGVDGSV